MQRLSSLIVILFIIITHHSQLHSVKAHIFIYSGCSQEKYATNSPFQDNLNSFLASAVSSSSELIYNSLALGNDSSSESAIYGLYQCRGDLKTTDCTTCVQSGVSQISLVCPYSYGAALQLEGCLVRYEHINFLGNLDTSLRYKKCSHKLVNNDVEFFRRRDDVLADLQSSGINFGFKVSSSGMTHGLAQCLGDLSSTDCSSCLGDAVGKLKNLCGSAAAADVFLGQCYARYWASGYYDFAEPSKEDDMGKTVAIIVGVLAGLAVIIIFLSICRRAIGP